MTPTRRRFIATAGSCASYMAAASPFLSFKALRRWRSLGSIPLRVVAQAPFARIEEVGPGLFAVVSTPLDGDYTTVCNGGIVAGSSGTLVVEAFATPAGARWVAERARELTGRWPTHVVVSHHHGDHSAGPGGFSGAPTGGPDGDESQVREAPALLATAATRDQVVENGQGRAGGGGPGGDEDGAATAWADVVTLAADGPTEIDLGDRRVAVSPRSGHTVSDATVELDGGEGPVWCGDLVWNAMFPNYMDARPSRLSRSVRALQSLPSSVFVPGHGPLADAGALADYVALIDSVEEAGRAAARRGIAAEEAARAYRVPESLGEWTLFNPLYYQRAIQSWLDELAGLEAPG